MTSLPNEITTHEEAMHVLQDGPLKFNRLSDTLKDDFSVVKAYAEQYGLILQYASERLRDNIELAKIALSVPKCGSVIAYLSPSIRKNFKLAQIAISNWTSADLPNQINSRYVNLTEIFPAEFFDSREFALHCCRRYGLFIRDFPKFISDEYVCDIAIKTTPLAYQFIDDALKHKAKYASALIQAEFAPNVKIPEAVFTKGFVLDNIKRIDRFVHQLPNALFKDIDVATEALKYTIEPKPYIEFYKIPPAAIIKHVEEDYSRAEKLPPDYALYFSTKEKNLSEGKHSALDVWLSLWEITCKRKIVASVISKLELEEQVENSLLRADLTENQAIAASSEMGLPPHAVIKFCKTPAAKRKLLSGAL